MVELIKCKIVNIISILLISIFTISFLVACNNVSTSTNSGEKSETVSSDYTANITESGTFEYTGSIEPIIIDTKGEITVKLSNVTINSNNGPAIYVLNAKKLTIILDGENSITSNTTSELDGAIYSKDDLILTGNGSLTIKSNYDGIVSKDTLVIEGGLYNITSDGCGIYGKDSVEILDGNFTINSKKDAIKSNNDEDETLGFVRISNGTISINTACDGIVANNYIIIEDGTFNISTTGDASTNSSKGLKSSNKITITNGTFLFNTTDDAINSNGDLIIEYGTFNINTQIDALHADGKIEINNGTFNIDSQEGLEATYVIINGGELNIKAIDDGINAGHKSDNYNTKIEINDGVINIDMAQGDTDGIDSNGDLTINGGTISVNATSPFDYDGNLEYNGGTIIVNGEETNTFTNQMFGGNRDFGNDKRRN